MGSGLGSILPVPPLGSRRAENFRGEDYVSVGSFKAGQPRQNQHAVGLGSVFFDADAADWGLWEQISLATPGLEKRTADRAQAGVKHWLHGLPQEKLDNILDQHLARVVGVLDWAGLLFHVTHIVRSGYGHHVHLWLPRWTTQWEPVRDYAEQVIEAINQELGYYLFDPAANLGPAQLCRDVGGLNRKGSHERSVVRVGGDQDARLAWPATCVAPSCPMAGADAIRKHVADLRAVLALNNPRPSSTTTTGSGKTTTTSRIPAGSLVVEKSGAQVTLAEAASRGHKVEVHCPGHDDTTASAVVYPGKPQVWCSKCRCWYSEDVDVQSARALVDKVLPQESSRHSDDQEEVPGLRSYAAEVAQVIQLSKDNFPYWSRWLTARDLHRSGTRCGFDQMVGESDHQGRLGVAHRPCRRATCHACSSRRLALVEAAILRSPLRQVSPDGAILLGQPFEMRSVYMGRLVNNYEAYRRGFARNPSDVRVSSRKRVDGCLREETRTSPDGWVEIQGFTVWEIPEDAPMLAGQSLGLATTTWGLDPDTIFELNGRDALRGMLRTLMGLVYRVDVAAQQPGGYIAFDATMGAADLYQGPRLTGSVRHSRSLVLDPQSVCRAAANSGWTAVTKEPGADADRFLIACQQEDVATRARFDDLGTPTPEPVSAVTIAPVSPRVRDRIIALTLGAPPESGSIDDLPDDIW